MRGDVRTFVRPIGGGVPSPLPPGHWEIDDFERRFATCTINPVRWWDGSAECTHWILVDGPAVMTWLNTHRSFAWFDEVVLAEDCVLGPQASDVDGTEPARNGGTASAPSNFLRLGEVLSRTGLSRTAVYERMAASTFPKQRAVGGRRVMWLESDVADWQRRQIGPPK